MLAPQIILKIRPNNQISLTVGNFRKKLPTVSQRAMTEHRDVDMKACGELAGLNQFKRDLYFERAQMPKEPSSPPLDIIKKSQRGKKIPSTKLNKPKSFTKFSGQKLRESGAAMQIATGTDTRFCHEVTLTLPANYSLAFAALAGNTAYIINRLFQPIRRKYGEMCHWFFVWEYQERGALHAHLAIYHPDESEGLYISAQLIDQWHKILCEVSERSGVCMFTSKNGDRCTIRQKHQHHTAPIQKDVGRYFSKYAGKEDSKNSWYIQKYPVSRFWGSSKAIKKIINENSFECAWDYFGNIDSRDEKLTQIIENILAKIVIVSSSSYEFDIKLAGKRRLNRYQNGRKILVTDEGKSVANGTRYTFYCEQNEFRKALSLIVQESENF